MTKDGQPGGRDSGGSAWDGADRDGADRDGADRDGADRDGADREGRGGFRWNLTPGGADKPPAAATPEPPAADAIPAQLPAAQLPAAQPPAAQPPAAQLPAGAKSPSEIKSPSEVESPAVPPSASPPANPHPPAVGVDDWDVPTAASPVIGRSVFPLSPPIGPPALLPPPYVPPPAALESPVASPAFPPPLLPAPLMPPPRFSHSQLPPPLDSALEGVTELLGAHPVGLPDPVDESPETSAIDVLFGESKFVDYDAATPQPGMPVVASTTPQIQAAQTQAALTQAALTRAALTTTPATTVMPGSLPPMSAFPFDTLPPLPASTMALYEGPRSAGTGTAALAPSPHAMPRPQKILIGIAGALVAALALVALFLLGMRIGQNAPAAEVDTIPTPGASAPESSAPETSAPDVPAAATGPVAPGDYSWDELLGRECLTFYESPWQETYSVVDCEGPHTGQLLSKQTIPDAAGAPYPDASKLQAAIVDACESATVIDYAAAGAVDDIQLEASYPATKALWDAGNRTSYCFVSRAGGGDLTGSLALPAT